MVNEVRIYVEGGGDGKDTKGFVRQGFSEFFKDLISTARVNRIDWKIIACGPRAFAYRNFQMAIDSHPTAFNVLLVDSESPISSTSKKHLESQDHWDLSTASDEQCHLMVQLMESWFLADLGKLERFYGQGFNRNPFPKTQNIEMVAKSAIEAALKQSTKNTTKGEYHKIRHGPKILGLLNCDNVRKASHNCNRLFTILFNKMN